MGRARIGLAPRLLLCVAILAAASISGMPAPTEPDQGSALDGGDPIGPLSATRANAGPDQSATEGSTIRLSGSATPGTIDVPVWSDSFDSYPLGSLTAPWTDESVGGSNYAEISSAVFHGASGRSMHLVDSDFVLGTTAARSIGSQTMVDMTVWAYALQTGGIFTPMLTSPEDWSAVRAGMGLSGFFIYQICFGSGWTTTAVPYTPGVWYRIRLVASSVTDTYDMYVDGSLVISNVALCTPSSSFTIARMVSAGSYVGEFYVDDVAVGASQPLTITRYAWDLNGARDEDGDGNFTNDADRLGATVDATYGDSGDYLATLTVTDSSGARANDTLLVSVANVPPEVLAFPASPVSITTGGELTIDVWDAGSDDLTIAWMWSDGPTGGNFYQNGATPDPPLSPWGTFPFSVTDYGFRMFPAPGVYNVTIVVGDDDGGFNGTLAQVDVRDVPETTLSIGSPTYIGASTFVNDSSAFVLSATDQSGLGISVTYYRVDGGAAVAYTIPFVLAQRGPHNIVYWSEDALGGVETPQSAVVYLDVDPPTTILTITGPQRLQGGTTWITPATTLWLSATDSESGVGATLHRTWTGAGWSAWTNAPLPASPPVPGGPFIVEVYSVDNLGQPEPVANHSFSVDGATPMSLLAVGSPRWASWVTDSTPFTLSSSDGSGVGVDSIEYRFWHAGTWSPVSPYGTRFFLSSGEGLYHVEYRAVDLLGNAEPWRNESFSVDLTPPASSMAVGEPRYNDWVSSATTFALAATDSGVGLDRIWYRLSYAGIWGPLTVYSGSFPLTSGEGPYVIEYQAVDLLGNAESVRTENWRVDSTPPSITPTVSFNDIDYSLTVRFDVSDAGSGVDRVQYRIEGGGWNDYVGPFVIRGKDSTHIAVRASDFVGNENEVGSIAYAPTYVNYKPALSTVLIVVLLVAALFILRRRKESSKLSYAILATFVATEAALGIASFLWDVLLFPPLLGPGLLVNLAVVTAGIVATYLVRPRSGAPS